MLKRSAASERRLAYEGWASTAFRKFVPVAGRLPGGEDEGELVGELG